MDKAKLEKWLDKIAKAVLKLASVKDFSDEIQVCDVCKRGIYNKPYFQLYDGIEQIAGELELGLRTEEDEDSITRILVWKGVEFIQYNRKGDL